MSKRCAYVKPDGSQCKMVVHGSESFCHFHIEKGIQQAIDSRKTKSIRLFVSTIFLVCIVLFLILSIPAVFFVSVPLESKVIATVRASDVFETLMEDAKFKTSDVIDDKFPNYLSSEFFFEYGKSDREKYIQNLPNDSLYRIAKLYEDLFPEREYSTRLQEATEEIVKYSRLLNASNSGSSRSKMYFSVDTISGLLGVSRSQAFDIKYNSGEYSVSIDYDRVREKLNSAARKKEIIVKELNALVCRDYFPVFEDILISKVREVLSESPKKYFVIFNFDKVVRRVDSVVYIDASGVFIQSSGSDAIPLLDYYGIKKY